MAEVVLEHVSKTYPGGVRALADLSLHVADGELLALVGPSGCGKTTLLRVLAGLTAPTAGTIRVGGRDATREPPNRRDLAFAFQRPALYPHLNVRANLGFGLGLRRTFGCLTAEERARVEEMARLLGLADQLKRRPAELSGGQQQRVALGRALVRRPAAFLLDEPLSGLDAGLRLEMRRELHLLQRRFRATMLYVTHDQEEALSLGDRVAVLDHGALRQVDEPAALVERPADRFVASFIGWPPMSFLDGQLIAADGGLCFLGAASVDVPARRRADWLPAGSNPAILGVRAEDAQLAAANAPGAIGMEVRRVEPFERGWLLTLTRGSWTLSVRMEGRPPVEGDRASVLLDLNRVHLFDLATGRAVSAG